MKRIIAFLVAATCSISAFAQFGIEAGLTSPDKSITGAVKNFKAIDLYHIGVMYKFGFLGDILAVQPALQYSVRGTCINSILTSDDTGASYRTGYLELPVQLQAGFGIADIVRIYGMAVPFIGVAIKNFSNTEIKWDISKNSFEYGVGLGVGFEFVERFQLSVQYDWNLGKVCEFKLEDIGKIKAANCNGVSFGIAFLF